MAGILFLSHRLPYPPDRGDRIRSWHVLNALAQRAPVHVVAPVDDAADLAHVAMVERVAASVTSVVRKRSRAGAVIRALATGNPASVLLFDVPVLRAAAAAIAARGEIDAVYAFSGQMARYVPVTSGLRFVLDLVDVDSAKFEERAAARHGPARWALAEEARRLRGFEAQAARRADACVLISAAEAALFRSRSGIAADVIENGIDTDRFAPDATAPQSAPHPLIVFTGQMDYAPNADAVVHFVRAVLPQIKGATFAIVGRAPTAEVRALASDRVIVTGEVADTRPWLAAADVVVAPLAIARGVQNKVLEAMAMGCAVVASPAAACGLDVAADQDLLVSDDPANAICGLIADPARRAELGRAARTRMLARYRWDTQLAPLAALAGPR